MPEPGEVSPLAHPTRARLVAVLRRLLRAASTAELARELSLHPNGVRRHLRRMAEAGILERHRVRHGRGRPRDEWSIAPGAPAAEGRREVEAELAGWLARGVPAGPATLRQVERTGREIGRGLAPERRGETPESLRQALAALGFEPGIERDPEGRLNCRLGNCPYRETARQNPALICTLHRGITKGLLERIDPGARLSRFEPRDPDSAGCLIEVSGAAA